MRFTDRKAVVTGAGSGQGATIARALAEEGSDVALLDLNLANAEKVAQQLESMGRKAIPLCVDVSDFKAVAQCFGRVYREFGRIDFLVNAAGYGQYVPFHEVTEEIWDRSIAVHLKGNFNCSRHVINGMMEQKFGRIVSIVSVAALQGSPRNAYYAAAKAGVIGLTKSIAKEVAHLGITVNAVAPGVIETPFHDNIKAQAPEVLAASVKATLVGRMGKPEEVASLCLYLLSDDAAFITGITIPIAGGYAM